MKSYSGKELVRLLQNHGWRLARVEGSHHIMTKPGREETISIPVHANKTLKTGIVHAILAAAGIKD